MTPIHHDTGPFPRWLTAAVIVGWVAVTAWITHFVGLTGVV